MSRIGKLPIALEKGVKATLGDGTVSSSKGPKGKLETRVHPGFVIDISRLADRGEAPGR